MVKNRVNRLAGKRTTYGITQQEMADMLGICISAYNKKENGRNKFNIIEINKILEFFRAIDSNIRYEDIFGE